MFESEMASDDDLLRRMRAGDERAFTALYRKHQGPVYRFALHMSGSADVAEEVAQDVFMVLIQDSGRYNSQRGTLQGYLFGIARNHVLRRLDRDDPERGEMQDVPDAHDIHGDFDRSRRIDSIRKAVLALPPNYREVIVLCELEEMDYMEAAVALGCAVGTIRSRLHRARALLSEKLRAAERCPA